MELLALQSPAVLVGCSEAGLRASIFPCSRSSGDLASTSRLFSSNVVVQGSWGSRRREVSRRSLAAATSSLTAEELPANLQKIVKAFQAVPDARLRYQQLLFFAKRLKPLAKELQVPENKVVGCVSQVWLVASLDDAGRLVFSATSDSELTKGLAALLVEGLSGATPEEVLAVSPEFVALLGLRGSLTPSRNNGFLNMLRLMQRKALEVQLAAGGGVRESSSEATSSTAVSSPDALSATGSGAPGGGARVLVLTAEVEAVEGDESTQGSMRRKILSALSPVELNIDDVSHEHAGHAGVHRGAKETHFNVRIVSAAFDGLTTIKRHRMVYGLLAEEFQKGLHALRLVTKSPNEIV